MSEHEWPADDGLTERQRRMVEEERRRQAEEGGGYGTEPQGYPGEPEPPADPYGGSAPPSREPRRSHRGRRGNPFSGAMSGCGCCSGMGCLLSLAVVVGIALVVFLLPLNTVFGDDNVCGSATAVECAQDAYETVGQFFEFMESVPDQIGDLFSGD